MAVARSTLIGVFGDVASAENALEALKNAGFSGDQLRYSGHSAASGGFLEGIKSLFTGTTGNSTENVVTDLMDLGLPQEEASYYALQHQNGHPIVAVRSDDRAPEAAQILQNNGGSSYRAGTGAAAARTFGQSTAYNQSANEQSAQPGRFTNNEQYAQQGNYTDTDQYNQNTNPRTEPSATYKNPDQFDQAGQAQGNQFNREINPQGDQYSRPANTPADQYDRQTYAQGDQYSQQRDYVQPDRSSQMSNPQANQYNQQANYMQPDQYNQTIDPQRDQYRQQTDPSANQYNQRADYTQPDQQNQSANYAAADQPPSGPAPRFEHDPFNQPTHNQTNQYDQPPLAPADQYNQSTYNQADQYSQPANNYGQGTQYDRTTDPNAATNAETEERRQARLRDERLRAERQSSQSQSQSQYSDAPVRDSYADDERNNR